MNAAQICEELHDSPVSLKSTLLEYAQSIEQQLEAANQRELGLLAVIARACFYLQEAGFKEGEEILCMSPSKALREHEAKVLEGLAKDFHYAWDGDSDTYVEHQVDNDTYEYIMRMAEERRKK